MTKVPEAQGTSSTADPEEYEARVPRFRDAILEILSGRTMHEDDPYYHYTDASGLLAILTNRSIYATNVAYLSDPKEYLYSRELFLEELDSWCQQGKWLAALQPQLRNALLDEERAERKERISLRPVVDVYTASFTSEGDLLSQWRAYADGGKGFSIGIKQAPSIAIWQFENRGIVVLPHRVEYKDLQQRKDIAHVLKALEEDLSHLTEEQGPTREDEALRASLEFRSYCSYFFPAFKKPGFSEEDEYRMIVRPVSKKTGLVKVRERNGLLVPYVNLGLIYEEDGLVPLDSIYIGPKQEFRLARSALITLLGELGYGTGKYDMPDIRPSATALV